jgi:hypothetical protein
MYTDKGEEVGSCRATLIPQTRFILPSSKAVFLVTIPLTGVALFILTFFVLRRVIRNNPDLSGDDLTYKSEGDSNTANSVFSDSTFISLDSKSSMKCLGSKSIQNNSDWCADDLRHKSEVSTTTHSDFSNFATEGQKVKELSNSATDYNNSMKNLGSKPIIKEASKKVKTIGRVGDRRSKKVEEVERGKLDPPDGIEELLLRTQKQHFGQEVLRSKSHLHLVRMRGPAVEKVPRRPKVQKRLASDDNAKAYHRMEEGNIKSVVVSASSTGDETTDYQLIEVAKTKSAVVSTSSAADLLRTQKQHLAKRSFAVNLPRILLE